MKKFLPYILIVVILTGIGFFNAAEKAYAESPKDKVRCGPIDTRENCMSMNQPITAVIDAWGTCTIAGNANSAASSASTNMYDSECSGLGGSFNATPQSTDDIVATPKQSNQTQFQAEILKLHCWAWTGPNSGINPPGCIVQVFYYLFYVLPAYLLIQTAYFFNVLISVSLSSSLFKEAFVGQAWIIVRDLSNIFFILILLYISIKVILGLGGSDVKKMITKVIIVALLINFSMFFTQIIIDSSNILASIFYNKLDVGTTVNGHKRDYADVAGEKDIAGGMVAAFDPTTTLKPEFFDEAKKLYVDGLPAGKVDNVPAGTMIALILIAGLIMCFTIYALFWAGLSFVGRLIELWVLIIFSPFAFMSSTIPLLSKREYIGWDAWFERLLTVSFMAPVFMFFLYFIFLLIKAPGLFGKILNTDGVGANDAAGVIKMLLGVVLPTMFILILLLKATEFAKKGSGKFGEVIMKGAKMAGGMALSAGAAVATSGASLAAQGTMAAAAVAGRAVIGRAGNALANDASLKDTETRGGWKGMVAGGLQRAGQAAASSTFDARGVKLGGKTLAERTGLNLGKVQEGGFAERKKAYEEKRQKRIQSLKMGENEPLKLAERAVQESHQELLRKDRNAEKIEELDNIIKVLDKRATDTARDARLPSSAVPGGPAGSAINPSTGRSYADDAKLAADQAKDATGERLAIKNASMFITSDGRMVDHRTATMGRDEKGNLVSKLNGSLSDNAITGIDNTQKAAAARVTDAFTAYTANPIGAINAQTGRSYADELALANNASAIATAARDTAWATRDVAVRDKAQEALTNNTNPALTAALTAALTTANTNVTASTTRANASAANVAGLTVVNPMDPTEIDALAKAQGAAADALNKIANGLTGRSINNIEDTDKPHAHHAIERENKRRMRVAADTEERSDLGSFVSFVASGGTYTDTAARKVAHEIRMDAKLDSGVTKKSEPH